MEEDGERRKKYTVGSREGEKKKKDVGEKEKKDWNQIEFKTKCGDTFFPLFFLGLLLIRKVGRNTAASLEPGGYTDKTPDIPLLAVLSETC